MDTIFAPATARGKSGVAVVRVSGPKAFEVAERLAGPLPDARASHEDAVGPDRHPGGQPHLGADDGVGADLDAVVEFGPVFHDRGGVDHLGTRGFESSGAQPLALYCLTTSSVMSRASRT